MAEEGSSLIRYDEIGSPFLPSLTVLVNRTSSVSTLSLLRLPASGVLSKTRLADMCLAGLPRLPPLKIS